MNIKEFRDLELAKATLYQMAMMNDLGFIVDEADPEVFESVARRITKIADALEEHDVEKQRNYLFTIMSLLMLNLESIGAKFNLED